MKPSPWDIIVPRVVITAVCGLLFLSGFTAATSRAASPSVYWGAWISGSGILGGTSDWTAVTTFESETAKPVSILNFFEAWASGTSSIPSTAFPATSFTNIRNHGSIPLFTWQPQNSNGVTQSFTLSAIISGSYDSYITTWATAAKTWGNPFFLRFAHEMNGNWYPWCEGVNGNTAGQYVKAWIHVHDIFTSVGATNVTWVWCVNSLYAGSTDISELYPGDNYVDWISMDAYNRGGANSVDFYDLIQPTHDALYAVAPGKPIFIAENGTVEDTTYPKPGWFHDDLMYYMDDLFPRIKAYSYFNANSNGYDNRINTSGSSQTAFATGIGLSYYTTNSYSTLATSPIPPLLPDAIATDNMPPFVTISSPSSQNVSAGTNVTIASPATDKSGIDHINYYVNGAYQHTENLLPYTWTWAVPSGAGKHYYVTAKAFDSAANMITSTIYYVSQ